jgi:hypothetical protein
MKIIFGASVGDWVCGHVKEEEVTFFGTENAFVHETLGKTFADLFELIPNLHQVPRFT